MRFAKFVFAAIALAAVAVAAPLAGSASDPPPAPDLSFTDAAGTPVSLAALRGKVVLLDIWASWCTPCRVAFPRYDEFYRRYKDRGFHVLAVNVDESRKNADRFLEGRNPAMKVVFDPAGRTPALFKTKGMPTSYLIDRRGRIRFVHEGFTERALVSYQHEIAQLLEEAP